MAHDELCRSQGLKVMRGKAFVAHDELCRGYGFNFTVAWLWGLVLSNEGGVLVWQHYTCIAGGQHLQ